MIKRHGQVKEKKRSFQTVFFWPSWCMKSPPLSPRAATKSPLSGSETSRTGFVRWSHFQLLSGIGQWIFSSSFLYGRKDLDNGLPLHVHYRVSSLIIQTRTHPGPALLLQSTVFHLPLQTPFNFPNAESQPFSPVPRPAFLRTQVAQERKQQNSYYGELLSSATRLLVLQ